MTFRRVVLVGLVAVASVAWTQTSAPQDSTPQTAPSLHAHHASTGRPDTTSSILESELPNMKADLAELRAMLNVLASQESGPDSRTSAALQTNRKMWQIVIARLADITERMEASEQRRGKESPAREPEKQK